CGVALEDHGAGVRAGLSRTDDGIGMAVAQLASRRRTLVATGRAVALLPCRRVGGIPSGNARDLVAIPGDGVVVLRRGAAHRAAGVGAAAAGFARTSPAGHASGP